MARWLRHTNLLGEHSARNYRQQGIWAACQIALQI